MVRKYAGIVVAALGFLMAAFGVGVFAWGASHGAIGVATCYPSQGAQSCSVWSALFYEPLTIGLACAVLGAAVLGAGLAIAVLGAIEGEEAAS